MRLSFTPGVSKWSGQANGDQYWHFILNSSVTMKEYSTVFSTIIHHKPLNRRTGNTYVFMWLPCESQISRWLPKSQLYNTLFGLVHWWYSSYCQVTVTSQVWHASYVYSVSVLWLIQRGSKHQTKQQSEAKVGLWRPLPGRLLSRSCVSWVQDESCLWDADSSFLSPRPWALTAAALKAAR